MKEFYGVPIYNTIDDTCSGFLQDLSGFELPISEMASLISQDKLVLLTGMDFNRCGEVFMNLAKHFDCHDSYQIQMQLVAHMIKDRDAVDDKAVTVNRRGPYQIIQAHAEGDSSSPLELFGLFCEDNAIHGGENILSHINQRASFDCLRAKEKVILDFGLSNLELAKLKRLHMDATEILTSSNGVQRILLEIENGAVGIVLKKIKKRYSKILAREVYTFWDNVTVHDLAFHKHHYQLLCEIKLLIKGLGEELELYLHIEDDSYWAPIDTESNTVEKTAGLFDLHVVHKMRKGDFLLFCNRTWTHAVNNWSPLEQRNLKAFYA